MTGDTVKRLARECGFELAGVATAEPVDDFSRYRKWVEQGYAGEMRYLTDRRAEVRRDPRNLLEGARSPLGFSPSPATTSLAGVGNRKSSFQTLNDVAREARAGKMYTDLGVR